MDKNVSAVLDVLAEKEGKKRQQEGQKSGHC